MLTEPLGAHTAPAKQLALLTLAALLAASVALLLFVLPAEFHIDPTGFGRATGLLRLAAAPSLDANANAGAATTTRYYPAPYRADTIEIPLAAAGSPEGGDELEYKVRMRQGDSFVYSWSVQGAAAPDQFYFDFHGETPASAGRAEPTVIEYRQATGLASNGTLIAAIDGVHGWYFQNQGTARVVVHLKLSGFYNLIPPGEYGNESRIKANKPLEKQGTQ